MYQKGEWLQISHSKNKQLERETYVSKEGEEKNGFDWQNGKIWWVFALIEIEARRLYPSLIQCPAHIWSV